VAKYGGGAGRGSILGVAVGVPAYMWTRSNPGNSFKKLCEKNVEQEV